ncbi:hypothetical protein AHAS_Ahas04G0156400 [Arachis hypogaea]
MATYSFVNVFSVGRSRPIGFGYGGPKFLKITKFSFDYVFIMQSPQLLFDFIEVWAVLICALSVIRNLKQFFTIS